MDHTLRQVSVYDDVELICSICNFYLAKDPFFKNINKEKLVNEHVLKEHLLEINESIVKCLKCEIQLVTCDIEKHFGTDQHQTKSCNKCDCEFNTIKQCYEHMQSCNSVNNFENLKNERYTCSLCYVKLERFEKLVDHYIESHVYEKICIICNKNFFSNIKKHLYIHRPGRMKFVCFRCFKCFRTKKELFYHKKSYDHSKKMCDICKKIYTGSKRDHDVKHNTNHICHVCGKIFSLLINLSRHIQTAHMGRRYYCDKCEYSNTTSYSLKRHCAEKHPPIKMPKQNSEEYYKCLNCPTQIAITDTESIEMHQNTHKHGVKFQCLASGCQYIFPDVASRLEHISQDHDKFLCDQCAKEFYNREQFKSHRFMHTWQTSFDVTENTCRICFEKFDNAKDLSKHVKKQYKFCLCPVNGCGEIFVKYATAVKHIKMGVHGEQLFKFSCDVCGEKTKSKWALLLHKKQHDANCTFKCSECGSLFRNSSRLKRHFRIHTGERPYECQFCKKLFSNETALKTHERIHTGEKPYACPICGKCFSDNSHCKRHISDHKVESYETLD